MDWLPQVDGYNLSYLRPGASAALLSGDEYRAPLVAFWQRGIGRVAAVTFPMAGDFSKDFRAWSSAPDFVQTLSRWLLPPPAPQGTSLRVKTVGNEVMVELLTDDTWTERLANTPPVLIVSDDPSVRTSLGTMGADRAPETGGKGSSSARRPLRGVVRAGDARWGFGPVAPSVDPEWDVSPTDWRNCAPSAWPAADG